MLGELIHSRLINLIAIIFFWILLSLLLLGLPSVPLGFPVTILYAFVFFHTCHMPCPSNTPWFKNHKVSKTYHEDHYAVFSTLLAPRSSQSQIFSPASYSRTTSAYVPPFVWETMFHTHTSRRLPKEEEGAGGGCWRGVAIPNLNLKRQQIL